MTLHNLLFLEILNKLCRLPLKSEVSYQNSVAFHADRWVYQVDSQQDDSSGLSGYSNMSQNQKALAATSAHKQMQGTIYNVMNFVNKDDGYNY